MDWSNVKFGYDSTGAFDSVANNLTKNPFGGGSKFSGGGNMLGLIGAFGSAALSGVLSGQQQARDREFAAKMGKMQAEMAMQGAMRQGQQNQWMAAAAPEYEFQRQKTAREFSNLFLEPQARYLRSEERQQQYRDETSRSAREASARERQGELARVALERRQVADAMFGAPVFNASRYSNPAWMQA